MSDSKLAKGSISKMSTNSNWKDLSVSQKSLEQIRQLEKWLNQSITPTNHTALFSGASGTGKTLTAELLGKYTQRDVYRVDLSKVVSKYIGETEKNIDAIFNQAAQKGWILFFDEADAIFGKRTNVRDAHDKYANMETSYLLRSIEKYHGLVMLSSNSTKNVSKAVRDSFDTVVEFSPLPFIDRAYIWLRGIFQYLSASKKN